MSTPSKFFATLSPRFRSPEAEFERFNCQASENLDAIEALLTSKGGTALGILEGPSDIGRSYAVRGLSAGLKENAKYQRKPLGRRTFFEVRENFLQLF